MGYTTNTNVSLADNFVISGISQPSFLQDVIFTQERYAVITKLSDMFSQHKFYAQQRSVSYGKLGNLGVTANITGRATNSIQSTWLDLTVSDSTFQQFRISDGVLSNYNNTTIGIVMDTKPGVVTVAPVNVTAFAATDFQVTSNLSYTSNISANAWSVPTQSVYNLPETDTFLIGMTRSDMGESREDVVKQTWYRWKKENGMWGNAQQELMVRKFWRSLENRILVSDGVQKNGYTTPYGILARIRNHGGNYIPLLNLSNLEAQLTNMVMQLVQNGSDTTEYLVLIGSGLMNALQTTVFKNYVTTAGKNSVLEINGQTIEGLSMFMWSSLGRTLKFVLYPAFDDWALFNTQTVMPGVQGQNRASYTALFLDTTPVNTSMGQESFIQKYIFGQQGAPEFGAYYINGLVGMDGGINGSAQMGSTGPGYVPVANGIDGYQYGIWTDVGYKVADEARHGLMEAII